MGLRSGGGRLGMVGKLEGVIVREEEEDCLLRRVKDGREKDFRCLGGTVGSARVLADGVWRRLAVDAWAFGVAFELREVVGRWKMDDALVCNVAKEFFSAMGSRRCGACTAGTKLVHASVSIARRSASGSKSPRFPRDATFSLLFALFTS